MQRYYFIGVIIFIVAITGVFAQDGTASSLLGGDNTVFDTSEESFTNPLPGLTEEQLVSFEEGDELFEQEFAQDTGLGPLFNDVSCEACHIEDGRGRPPAFTGETNTGFLIRLAHNEQNLDGSTIPDSTYGGQFQDVSIDNVPAEGTIHITYREIRGTYADGSVYVLYEPTYDLINLNYGPLDVETTLSPRLANQMIGLGMLEAIPEETLLALSDPTDANGDGISGRPNYVWDAMNNRLSIGRFGWKASQPTLLQQSLGAFNGDIGITSNLKVDQPCTTSQVDCLLALGGAEVVESSDTTVASPMFISNNTQDGCRDGRPGGCRDNDGNRRDGRPRRPENRGRPPQPNGPSQDSGSNDSSSEAPDETVAEFSPEITDETALLVTFYSSTLSVPAQRNVTDPQVVQGQQLFTQANCIGCHVTNIQTGLHPTIPQLSNQTIHPYSDLLLHDMGPGLADNQIDFQATGQEWRTAPLWGLGLFETVNGYAFYLHDGRARSIEEAILWHGGEAEFSRDAFINMTAEERAALIAFLRSL